MAPRVDLREYLNSTPTPNRDSYRITRVPDHRRGEMLPDPEHPDPEPEPDMYHKGAHNGMLVRSWCTSHRKAADPNAVMSVAIVDDAFQIWLHRQWYLLNNKKSIV